MTSLVHTTTLTHDITGQPKHYVESISIPRDDSPQQLLDRGFRYESGWRDKQSQPWDLYIKTIPV